MKRFHFPLERVREWREKQVAAEETRLDQLRDQRRALEQSHAALESELRASETAVIGAESADAVALQALDHFRRYTRARQSALGADCRRCDDQIAAQRLRVMEAQRSVRLLDKVKERKLKLWQAGFEKELEEQAAEAHRTRWNSESAR